MLMGVLTVRNVGAENLRETILRLHSAFDKLMRRKRYQVWGNCIRKLEITYNAERNDYHPHLHILIFVRPGYFTNRDYISHDKLLEDWRECYGDAGITQVDIRRCRDRNGRGSAILEVAKYSAKVSDYLHGEEIFNSYAQALRGIRLMGYSGECKRLRKLWDTGELEGDEQEIEYVWELLYQYFADGDTSGYMQIDMHKISAEQKGSGTAHAAQSSRRG